MSLRDEKPTDDAWRAVTADDPRARALLEAYWEILGAVFDDLDEFLGITERLDRAIEGVADLGDVLHEPALLQLRQLANSWTDPTEETNDDDDDD
jgi:hypothetical protein